MRTPQPSRTPDDSARRGPATPAKAGGPLHRLLALQRAAGNAAVVQMLREEGHPLAPAQERHAHGPGCGHQSATGAGAAPVQRSAVHEVLRSGGRPLDDATRGDMESRLGADFSDVRVHTDAAAKASASEIGARAYTSGNHVVLGEGGGDKHTLAHELTHVIQQRQGPVAGADNGSGLRVSDPSDRFEREAEANATRVMRAPARTSGSGTGEDLAAPQSGTAQAGPAQPFVQRVLNQTAVPTASRHEAVQDGQGRAVRSEMLNDGSLVGSTPSQDPPGYDYIRSLKLTSQWIRFHLVNEKAGGPGTANNLVPAAQSDNQNYEKGIEKDLKNDVTAAAATPGAYVYFGVQVHYNNAAPAQGSASQLNSAHAFPSSLTITHKLYDPAAGWQAGKHNGATFAFQVAQPADSRVAQAISGIDLATLRQYTGFPPSSKVWDTPDLDFLKSIATGGARQTEFQGIMANYGGTVSERILAAFYAIPFSPPRAGGRAAASQGATKFAERIGNEAALEVLANNMGTGMLT
ncbi:protein of unknown function [Streptomyces sp. yr375]|uniref:eCIS core domain-containing protein n=1 Tax=Streptomyces sp. yr375 TaxID=1761906 RepID=UPI0008D42C35|nr:DUF4157 domain-containing protein [Streptomyces sp. yr375]SES43591.1 protein of unknown function [Streptomyces sp. yr375]